MTSSLLNAYQEVIFNRKPIARGNRDPMDKEQVLPVAGVVQMSATG